MSASERLKALESFTSPTHGPTPMWVATSVLAALPEIIAVVEALEEIDGMESDAGTYDVVWDGVRQWVPKFKVIARAALAALDDALTTKGEQ